MDCKKWLLDLSKMNHKALGYTSIIVSLIVEVFLIYNWLFIDYFTGVGIKSTIGIFFSYLILLLAGIFMIRKKIASIIAYKLFFYFLVSERIFVCILFYKYLHFIEVLSPILIGLPFYLISFRKNILLSK